MQAGGTVSQAALLKCQGTETCPNLSQCNSLFQDSEFKGGGRKAKKRKREREREGKEGRETEVSYLAL